MDITFRKYLKGLFPRSAKNRKPYDEFSYWNSRTDPNAPSGWDEDRLNYDIGYIKTHTDDCERVLEIGPGVGRVLEAYSSRQIITCYDISSLYKERLHNKADVLGLNIKIDIAAKFSERLPYDECAFDACVMAQVLLHQRPENVRPLMKEAARVARKVVVISGYHVAEGDVSHVFRHDYPESCTSLGCKMDDVRAWGGSIYFVFKKI